MVFSIAEENYLLGVYENNDGSTTLTRLGTTAPESYSKICNILVQNCQNGDGKNFSLAIPHFPEEHFESLKLFLETKEDDDGAGAILLCQEKSGGADLYRYKGPQGHSLAVKYFPNHTLQLQGIRTMLTADVLDFLSQVLPYDKSVQAQLTTFKVNLSVAEVSSELEGRLPTAYSNINEIVRAQLASALALTKIEVNLLDYGAVAFPALRGLEGFLWQELARAKFDVKRAKDFGDYFVQDTPHKYKMLPVQAEFVGDARAEQLANCYSVFARQRHGIAHFGRIPEATRVLDSLAAAVSVVTEVLATIEHFCTKMST